MMNIFKAFELMHIMDGTINGRSNKECYERDTEQILEHFKKVNSRSPSIRTTPNNTLTKIKTN